MDNRVDYQSPGTPRPHPPQRRAAHAFRTGLVLVVTGVCVMFLPLLFVGFGWNKYLVAIGIALTCLGLGMSINGGWDWLRGKP
jgi:hypothetical protein